MTKPAVVRIELRWEKGLVSDAKGLVHSPGRGQIPVYVNGLNVPIDEVDWSKLADQLYQKFRDSN